MKPLHFFISLSLAAILLITIASCTRTRGCTDPTASNYNPSAKTNDGNCTYNGTATFYFDQNGPNAIVMVNGQTDSVTTSYQQNSPGCGTSAVGCANFILPAGTYSYNASSSATNWRGQTVTINPNGCTEVLLTQSTGSVVFYAAHAGYAPITVNINGAQQIITGYVSSGTPTCGLSGCATFNLYPGTYTYTATIQSGSIPHSTGIVIIGADSCSNVSF